jgi:hypothetical protein
MTQRRSHCAADDLDDSADPRYSAFPEITLRGMAKLPITVERAGREHACRSSFPLSGTPGHSAFPDPRASQTHAPAFSLLAAPGARGERANASGETLTAPAQVK